MHRRHSVTTSYTVLTGNDGIAAHPMPCPGLVGGGGCRWMREKGGLKQHTSFSPRTPCCPTPPPTLTPQNKHQRKPTSWRRRKNPHQLTPEIDAERAEPSASTSPRELRETEGGGCGLSPRPLAPSSLPSPRAWFPFLAEPRC